MSTIFYPTDFISILTTENIRRSTKNYVVQKSRSADIEDIGLENIRSGTGNWGSYTHNIKIQSGT